MGHIYIYVEGPRRVPGIRSESRIRGRAKWQIPACVSITRHQVIAEESNELRTLNLVIGDEQCRDECSACTRRLQIGSLDKDIVGGPEMIVVEILR